MDIESCNGSAVKERERISYLVESRQLGLNEFIIHFKRSFNINSVPRKSLNLVFSFPTRQSFLDYWSALNKRVNDFSIPFSNLSRKESLCLIRIISCALYCLYHVLHYLRETGVLLKDLKFFACFTVILPPAYQYFLNLLLSLWLKR